MIGELLHFHLELRGLFIKYETMNTGDGEQGNSKIIDIDTNW